MKDQAHVKGHIANTLFVYYAVSARGFIALRGSDTEFELVLHATQEHSRTPVVHRLSYVDDRQ